MADLPVHRGGGTQDPVHARGKLRALSLTSAQPNPHLVPPLTSIVPSQAVRRLDLFRRFPDLKIWLSDPKTLERFKQMAGFPAYRAVAWASHNFPSAWEASDADGTKLSQCFPRKLPPRGASALSPSPACPRLPVEKSEIQPAIGALERRKIVEIQRTIEHPLPVFDPSANEEYKYGTPKGFYMGILFDRKPRTYVPPPGEPKPTMLDQAPTAPPPATGGRTAIAVSLPGLQETAYLDSAREAGHDINFSSAHRTQQEQDDIISSGKGRTPAKQSLHSAGLAVDIGDFDEFPESKKLAIRKAAERAGLSWGGMLTPKDTIHFYFDPLPEQISDLLGQRQ